MITVLTIIIIVLAIAIPVWNALLGGTNLASAQNKISAFLSNARADAIFNRQTIGVFFYIDPKTQLTTMAEVQVQSINSAGLYTPLFSPQGQPAADKPVYALELVNNPDPSNPGNFSFYRDPLSLPKGVGVVVNCNQYTYNDQGLWNFNPTGATPAPYTSAQGPFPPLDRYMHVGAILFAPDGTLTSLPIGVPYQDQMQGESAANSNLLCGKIGMSYGTPQVDFGSNVTPGANNPALPLMSSVGFVVFDRDIYLTQHRTSVVMDNSGMVTNISAAGTQTTIGDGQPFDDGDMNPTLNDTVNVNFQSLPLATQAADKFIEEAWIDKNGTAFLINPTSGALIQAK